MKREVRISIPLWRSVVVLLLAGITVALCLSAQPAAQGDDAGLVLELPSRVIHYSGDPGKVTEAEKRILPTDTGFAKMQYYGLSSKGAEERISCTIVLSANDRRSLHRPEVCLPGQGWTIDSAETVPIEMPSGGVLEVKKLGLSQEREIAKDQKILLRAVYIYWYVGKDVTTPSTLERVMLTAFDNVFRNVNHRWAYVSVMSLITEQLQPKGLDDDETMVMLEEFVREVVPTFQKVL